jgi:hypothetical protein
MQARRPRRGAAVPEWTSEIEAALDREKSRFLARNLDRCGYLRVQLEPPDATGRRLVSASFTLDSTRRWFRVEAEMQREAVTDHEISALFARLEDDMGAMRLAQLFSPMTEAQRLASGRL